MPACELPDGETVNLSFLSSEKAWQSLRDVANNGRDRRRSSPPFLWLGVITCDCVLQAIRALSLETSPMPHRWPSFIEFPFVSLQRVACVDTPLRVGELWDRGHGGNESARAASDPLQQPLQQPDAGLPWAYVPATAFLKQFPAHSPTLLPPGFVSEEDYRHPPARAVDLPQRTPTPPAPRRMPLEAMLPDQVGLRLVPRRSCAPHACEGLGWCEQRQAASPSPTCACLFELGEQQGAGQAFGGRRRRHGGRHPWRAGGSGGEEGGQSRCSHRAHQAGRRYRQPPWQRVGMAGGASFGRRQHELGPDYWRASADGLAVSPCPNGCSGRGRGGRCAYGFCHCEPGHWGIDCGHSLESVASAASSSTAAAHPSPRIHVYPLPPALRRSCNWWHLAEDVGERLLRSEHSEADPARADLFWVYGCPNGDTILPALRWIWTRHPHWNASVVAGRPRHVLVVGHEEGWAEVWRYLVHWLRGPDGDHANKLHVWDALHPASPTRQLAILQLSGRSDYPAEGQRNPIRCVSSDAPCYVCFQPGKDVMVPGHPGLIDYPNHECGRLHQLSGYEPPTDPTPGSAAPSAAAGAVARRGTPRPRAGSPQVLFGGAVWTIAQGPGLYEPSRVVLYLCHKNASRLRRQDYLIVQTETQPESVRPWEVEQRIDLTERARQASLCVVPDGKAGGYGHRAIQLLMLGCVPLYSKERFSRPLFEEAVNWSSISLHVPPVDMPRLPQILAGADVEGMRAAISGVRRRLLWTSIYGPCHLREGEGGEADAFDTLMEVLAKPRVHFRLSADHRAPRAPEQMPDLKRWLIQHGGAYCTQSG